MKKLIVALTLLIAATCQFQCIYCSFIEHNSCGSAPQGSYCEKSPMKMHRFVLVKQF